MSAEGDNQLKVVPIKEQSQWEMTFDGITWRVKLESIKDGVVVQIIAISLSPETLSKFLVLPPFERIVAAEPVLDRWYYRLLGLNFEKRVRRKVEQAKDNIVRVKADSERVRAMQERIFS